MKDLFVYDSILYCSIEGGHYSGHRFGDATIPYFAGWDGQQWCGTPFIFQNTPQSFGFANDTLFATFSVPSSIDGNSPGYMQYYEGDYLHNPYAICSTLGLGEEELSYSLGEVKVYPNPAHSSLKVSITVGIVEQVKIYILSGKCVLEKGNDGLPSVELDIFTLAQGVYVLEVNGEYNERVVKM